MQSRMLRILTLVVMGYMLLAFSWWAVLLYTKNKDAYQAKTELLKLQAAAQGVNDPITFEKLPQYQEIDKAYRKQEIMITVEGFAFVISLLIALLFINRAYRKAVENADQRRNFLLSITHELKSPLASLRLASETILRKDLRPEQMRLLASNNLKDTDRLTKLVDNLLLAAKVEGDHSLKLEGISMYAMIRDLLDYYKKLYPAFDFNFKTNDRETIIHADRPALNSILRNLIENAIKYSPDEKRIQVEVSTTPDEHTLEVNDRGVGIPRKLRPKVFEQFYRVGAEDTRKTKGTGLGLFIVKKLVDLHEWTIDIRDNKPKGTAFVITIPRKIA